MSKWVDTSKNIHEKHKPNYVPEVRRGWYRAAILKMRKAYVQTPLVTSDIKAQALVVVFAACHGVPLFSSDIKTHIPRRCQSTA